MSGGRTIALLGPTGVGKTAVAVELAQKLGTRIIACDSMQVYQGFSILTNQPTRSEERRDLHEMVGFLDPGRTMSAGEYAEIARPLVDREIKKCGMALLVGGSGLYMRTAVAPLAARAPGDPALRASLEERARTKGPVAIHEELSRLDPEAAARTDARNVRRVTRAIEGVLSHGTRWSGRGDLWAPEYYHPTLTVGLWMERSSLAARIESRTEWMLAEGAVEEVTRFRDERDAASTRPGHPGICSAIGYREISDFLDGELDHEGCVERMAAATRRYARRQSTWIRKVRDAVMIETKGRDPGQIAQEIVGLAERMVEEE